MQKPPIPEWEKQLPTGLRLVAWHARQNGKPLTEQQLRPGATDPDKGQVPSAVKQLLQQTASAYGITLRELLAQAEKHLGYTLTSLLLKQSAVLKQIKAIDYTSSTAIDADQFYAREKFRNEQWLRQHGNEITPLGMTRYEYAMRERKRILARQTREQLRQQTGNFDINFDPETGEIFNHEMRLSAEKISRR